MTLQEFLRHFPDARPRAGGYGARCPVHEDDSPSLQISQGKKGILLKCHSGCETNQILAHLGRSMADLYSNENVTGPAPVQSWDILDVTGQYQATHRRRNKKDGNKYPPWWEVHGKKGLGGRSTKELPFYNSQALPRYDHRKTLYLCEGEPDTDSLLSLGLQAIGTVTGATCIPVRSVLETLLGFQDVRLWPDNDLGGKKHMQQLATALHQLGIPVSLLEVEGLPEGGGATDWLRQQKDPRTALPQKVNALARDVYPFGGDVAKKSPGQDLESQPTPKALPRARSLAEFMALKVPPKEELLSPWLRQRDLVQLYGWRGGGKTWIAMGIAYAVASGGAFLRWRAQRARGVLYVDGELPVSVLQERIARIEEAAEREQKAPFLVLASDELDGGLPDLGTRQGQEVVEANLAGVELLVLDNLSCLLRSGTENDAESWQDFQSWLLSLRRRGLTVIFLHHAGKGGGQRGTSKREDVLDTVLALRKPPGYSPEDGARVELHFEKARGLYGEAIAPLEAHLREDEQGALVWALQSLESGKKERIRELAKGGMGHREIAREIGCSPGYVSKVLRE